MMACGFFSGPMISRLALNLVELSKVFSIPPRRNASLFGKSRKACSGVAVPYP